MGLLRQPRSLGHCTHGLLSSLTFGSVDGESPTALRLYTPLSKHQTRDSPHQSRWARQPGRPHVAYRTIQVYQDLPKPGREFWMGQASADSYQIC